MVGDIQIFDLWEGGGFHIRVRLFVNQFIKNIIIYKRHIINEVNVPVWSVSKSTWRQLLHTMCINVAEYWVLLVWSSAPENMTVKLAQYISRKMFQVIQYIYSWTCSSAPPVYKLYPFIAPGDMYGNHPVHKLYLSESSTYDWSQSWLL